MKDRCLNSIKPTRPIKTFWWIVLLSFAPWFDHKTRLCITWLQYSIVLYRQSFRSSGNTQIRMEWHEGLNCGNCTILIGTYVNLDVAIVITYVYLLHAVKDKYSLVLLQWDFKGHGIFSLQPISLYSWAGQ